MQSKQLTFNTSDIKILNRNYIEITGVEEVISYDEASVVLVICGDRAIIEGEELRITELCVQEGRVSIKGRFISLSYEDLKAQNTGFFSKLFRS